MKRKQLVKKIIIGALTYVLSTAIHAGIPVWTFAPDASFPPSISVTATGTATIKYTVTNQSRKPHRLVMRPIKGIKEDRTAGDSCRSKYPIGYHESCTLTLEVDGRSLGSDVVGGPVLCERGNRLECYQPSPGNGLAIRLKPPAILTPSHDTLALSTACTTSKPFCVDVSPNLTGKPRQITITNTSKTETATNVKVSKSSLPRGTQVTSTCEGVTLAPGSSCVITVTPGAGASPSATDNLLCTAGKAPLPGKVKVTADGGVVTNLSIFVLSYGCVYEGGFIFAVDDTTAHTRSIGGKVASRTNVTTDLGIPWDADPACAIAPFQCANTTGAQDLYIGANLANVAGSTNSYEGGTPGNTFLISAILTSAVSADTNNPPTYAAGQCIHFRGEGYSDWYLPAICEMGEGDFEGGSAGCAPGTQNMSHNLPLLITQAPCDPKKGCLFGLYWSSTETSTVPPPSQAWSQRYSSGMNTQVALNKNLPNLVRCTRAF